LVAPLGIGAATHTSKAVQNADGRNPTHNRGVWLAHALIRAVATLYPPHSLRIASQSSAAFAANAVLYSRHCASQPLSLSTLEVEGPSPSTLPLETLSMPRTPCSCRTQIVR